MDKLFFNLKNPIRSIFLKGGSDAKQLVFVADCVIFGSGNFRTGLVFAEVGEKKVFRRKKSHSG
jgi:hypothetical protein